MLTLFLLLLSPPTSPSPRVENPRAAENRILIEELLREDRQAAIDAAASKAQMQRFKEMLKQMDADAERTKKKLRELDEIIKQWEAKKEPAKK